MNSDRRHLKVPTKIEEQNMHGIYEIMQQKFEAA
jgi:hypothetical protein